MSYRVRKSNTGNLRPGINYERNWWRVGKRREENGTGEGGLGFAEVGGEAVDTHASETSTEAGRRKETGRTTRTKKKRG